MASHSLTKGVRDCQIEVQDPAWSSAVTPVEACFVSSIVRSLTRFVLTRCGLLIATFIIVAQGWGQGLTELTRVPPTPPERAEATFRTADGFRMRLLAAEPLVTDPVDLAYDENGRAYVAEMRGYPVPEGEVDHPLGRVKILRDLDGDGVFDDATVFADGLHWPTSVMPWNGGIFVLAPPDLWYMQDVDGDDRADVRKRIVTGFDTFNVQAVANNLRWGCDGRIYGAGSGNGGTLTLPDGTAMQLRRADFSFDPLSLDFREETGAGRYGNTFDDYGNRFICNIRNPVIHVVIDRKYLVRNPVTALMSGLQDVAPSGDQVPVYPVSSPEPWRLLRARRWALDPRAVPRSELVATGFFTSACGLRVCRGDRYGEEARKHVFVCEVAYNLVHREVLRPEEASFRSDRIDQGKEVVASTDNWFRPVNLINAPDGTLHVVDMYREVIEHPWSIPDDLLQKLDLTSGVDRGRIYRLEPADFAPPPIQWPGNLDTIDLVPLLASPSSWWSDTAQRLLIERHDVAARPALEALVRSSSSPRARILALWTLDRMGCLEPELLVEALNDGSPLVRRQAIRIAESYVDSDAVRTGLLAAARDPHPGVRLQAILSAGELVPADQLASILTEAALRDGRDHWFAVAIASSASTCAGPVVTELLNGSKREIAQMQDLVTLLLRTTARVEKPAAIAHIFEQIAQLEPLQRLQFAQALIADLPSARKRDPSLANALAAIQQLAIHMLASDNAAAAQAALSVLSSSGQYASVRNHLLLAAQHGVPSVATAAVQAIAAHSDAQAGLDLLAIWQKGPKGLRDTVMLQLMRRTPWRKLVLDEIEAGHLPADAVPKLYQHVLTGPQGGELAARARRLFATDRHRSVGESDREVAAYIEQVRGLAGNAERGRRVFSRNCAACHRLHGEGTQVGPDLSSVQRRTAEELLIHIVMPNREVAPEYVQYLVATKSDQLIAGVIERESGDAVQLINQQGERITVRRDEIVSIKALGVSLMPEGFAERISPPEMADLLVYLLQATSAKSADAQGQ